MNNFIEFMLIDFCYFIDNLFEEDVVILLGKYN